LRLVIWGSCVTRDVLEVGRQPVDLEYHARTSWVSQASSPQPPPVPTPEGAGFGERMVREDLTKEVVADIVASQPDAAVSLLAPELASALPRTRVVLHQAWYTARSADPAVQFYASATKNALSSNEALSGWYASLRSVFGRRLHVVEPPRHLLVGDPRHRWGLAHYHYVPEYYAWAMAALSEIADGPVIPRRTTFRPPSWAPDWAQVAA